MSATGQDAQREVIMLRPFLPAKDWPTSFAFYQDLGFRAFQISERFASMSLGPFGFFLQDYYVKDWAENMMMHLATPDVDRWWDRIAKLDLPGRYGVKPPAPPKLEPWGLKVAYVWDPSGVLWHFAQEPDGAEGEPA